VPKAPVYLDNSLGVGCPVQFSQSREDTAILQNLTAFADGAPIGLFTSALNLVTIGSGLATIAVPGNLVIGGNTSIGKAPTDTDTFYSKVNSDV